MKRDFKPGKRIGRKAAFALLMLAPTLASAWGAEAHRLIAELAYNRLAGPTRERVRALLSEEPGATLPSVSTWADKVRTPTTAVWHYTNFDPSSACRYVEQRNCPKGQCVVGALERQVQMLSTAKTRGDQLKALKWVVHLVGDAHQPLHAGIAWDKGGNLFQVQAFGRGTNLHAVWDSVLIGHWPGGPSALRAATLAQAPSPTASLSPRSWAQESCEIVSRSDFYPDGRFITDDYQQRWSPVIATRLAIAADRLAQTLNRALP